jgi:ABC-type multidrug transport system fused ATPase/permease subunit
VAIVGPSGAGKSTLVNLLLRFWDYQDGIITLDGCDLREYPPDDVRRLMGVVSQHTYLFNATLRDNLLIAKPDATQAELEQAARRAQLDAFIQSLPQGYDTWIGEQGLRLSGGERQRLAIARALLKDAPILILDEATANLDPVTEREVIQAIREAMQGRATLIITHRLVGLQDADEILALQSGRVVERGRHHDLLRANGLYRRMWELQNQILLPVR